jgi:Ca2+-binding EF-hand superfamily protein
MEILMPQKDKLSSVLAEGIDKADFDGDGKISCADFILFADQFMDAPDDLFLRKWFHGLDIEGLGKIEYRVVVDCFRAMLEYWGDIEQGRPPLKLLKVFFRAIDTDRNGKIDLNELTSFMRSVDSSMSTYLGAVELRKMDRTGDSDGRVSFTEFCEFYGVILKKNEDPWEGRGTGARCCVLL